jgi:hypothetical protein
MSAPRVNSGTRRTFTSGVGRVAARGRRRPERLPITLPSAPKPYLDASNAPPPTSPVCSVVCPLRLTAGPSSFAGLRRNRAQNLESSTTFHGEFAGRHRPSSNPTRQHVPYSNWFRLASGQETTNIGPKPAEAPWKKARVLDWADAPVGGVFRCAAEPGGLWAAVFTSEPTGPFTFVNKPHYLIDTCDQPGLTAGLFVAPNRGSRATFGSIAPPRF